DLDWKFPKPSEEQMSTQQGEEGTKTQIASTLRVNKGKGKAKVKVPTQKKMTFQHHGLRASTTRVEAIIANKPRRKVKVTNYILALRAHKSDVVCSSKRRRS
ncbi:hypothetical protein Tco_0544440, partial [Tanacetum coccineum]